jgi:hypothetical protein
MVLLTSSTISVAISSSIICMFTFLLFMSGYVMQQQTVRSLQDALHAPPVPRPTPTLPPQFQKLTADSATPVLELAALTTEGAEPELEDATVELDAGDGKGMVQTTGSNLHSADGDAVILGETASAPDGESPATSVEVMEAAVQNEPVAAITTSRPSMDIASTASPSDLSAPTVSVLPLRLAYVLTVAKPSQICSALLFFRQHSQSRKSDSTDRATTTYLLLYPSRWETDPSDEAHTSAISVMRPAQDSLDIVYHPVRTTEAWSGLEAASIQSQLLGELQRYHWAFDRMLYLKTPGLATDIAALDAALSSGSGSLRRNWVLLSKISSASRDAMDPPIMLLSEKGILIPRGELRGRLAVSAATSSHTERHASEMDTEAASKSTAYVYFHQEDLDHPREEKKWHDGVFERYERGVYEVCKGSVFDVQKGELRRR